MRGQRDATGRAYDQSASRRCGFMHLMTAGKVSGQNRAGFGRTRDDLPLVGTMAAQLVSQAGW